MAETQATQVDPLAKRDDEAPAVLPETVLLALAVIDLAMMLGHGADPESMSRFTMVTARAQAVLARHGLAV